MAKALIGLMERLRAKPDIEGEPEMEEESGPGREEGPEEEAPESEERRGAERGYDEHAEMALDDLADIAGVSPEDRADFGAALSTYVHACIAKAMGEHEEPEAEVEEEPEQEPEEEERDDEE